MKSTRLLLSSALAIGWWVASASAAAKRSASNSFWNEAPWQSNNARGDVLEEMVYESQPPIVFSPTGRLYAVERMVQASRASHPMANLVLALQYESGIVLLSTLPTSPHMNVTKSQDDKGKIHQALFLVEAPSATSPVFHLQSTLSAAVAGNAVDNQVLRGIVQSHTDQLVESHGGNDDFFASTLARNLADRLQLPTQSMQTRKGNRLELLASSLVIIGDEEIWRIDPTGQFWKCHAVAIGRDAERAEEALYQAIAKEMKNDDNDDNTIDIGTCLKSLSSARALDLLLGVMESLLQPTIKYQPNAELAAPRISRIFWKSIQLDYGKRDSEKKGRVHRSETTGELEHSTARDSDGTSVGDGDTDDA